jgi:uncharacterized repeat protein (TIGR01451 family)
MREPEFELSADMRLLDLQRGALGLPPRERTSWESRTGAETSLPIAQAELEPGRTPVLAVEASAFPAEGVIPGAVVTLSLTVANEGAALASEVVVAAPLPGGAAYRPGSFAWNGRSTYDDVAERFFGHGLPIGGLAPGSRAAFTWKIGVRLGSKPLVIAPQVRAAGAAIVGAHPLVIERKESAPPGAFAGELAAADAVASLSEKPLIPVEIPVADLPVYELDEEEQLEYEAAAAAMSPAAPPIQAPPALEAAAPPAPQNRPQAQPAARCQDVVLYGRFDRATLSFFERVFLGAKPPTILQHCIFGGTLACALDADGSTIGSLKRHLDAQSHVLHRIVLHEKLGKKEPIAGYAGELLAEVEEVLRPSTLLAPFAPDSGRSDRNKDALLLVAELSEPTRQVIRKIAEERERWDFVRARQLTLALQAHAIASAEVDEVLREQIASSLRAYAQASVTALQRLFVRIRLDRTTGLLFQPDVPLDTAAKAVIAAFKLALA